MVKEEMVPRLFYVDKIYTTEMVGKDNKNPHEVKVHIQTIKRKIVNLNLNYIKTNLSNDSLFNRIPSSYCKLIELDLSKLCFDQFHGAMYGALWGRPFFEFLINMKEARRRINSVKPIAKTLLNEIPSLVTPLEDKYQVLIGNHRLLALLEEGYKTCKVLCLCPESEAEDFPDLKFPLIFPE